VVNFLTGDTAVIAEMVLSSTEESPCKMHRSGDGDIDSSTHAQRYI